MIYELWAYLTAAENRESLTWLGSGLVVVAGGIWAVLKFFLGRSEAPRTEAALASAPAQNIRADRGGQAAGGDLYQHSGNTTTVQNGLGGWKLVAVLALLAGVAVVAVTQVGGRVGATEGSATIAGDVGGDATVTTTVDQSQETTQSGNTATADDSSVAVGGDVSGSTITVGD